MRKIFLALAFLIVSLLSFAQEHIEFKGIPLNGSSMSFASKLKAKGYEQVYHSNFDYVLKGQFTGKEATVYVLGTRSSGTVWKVVAQLPEEDSWAHLKSDYNKYIELFTQKYGTPSDHFEFFSTPYYEGDGYELQALKNDKCTYSTYFKTEKGTLNVAITSSGNLSLGYEDKINTEIQTEEKNNADLNDI